MTDSAARKPLDAGLTSEPSDRMSLARRFLLANLVVVVLASLGVAAWVGSVVEESVLNHTASVTALYIQSFIEPQIEELASSSSLSAERVGALDRLVTDTQFGHQVASFQVWKPDGTIVYASNHDLIGRTFVPDRELADAAAGEVLTVFTDLSGPEHPYLRARWSRLVETYVPVRRRGGAEVIGIAEVYQLPDEIDAEVSAARLRSWAVVAIAALASYLLLAGIVNRGSETIVRQQAALRDRVAELSHLLDQNAQLHGRVRRAANRSTALNEIGLRQIGSDIHDGPAQTLSLALLRLDEDGQAGVADALSSALGDLRLIASGLRSPAFDDTSAADVAARAVREHQRRTAHQISLQVGALPHHVPDATKIALYRVLQEALSNASRHAGGAGIEVDLAADSDTITLEVRDRGPGLDEAAERAGALGVAGMRERADLLGGSFEISPQPDGRGTVVRLRLPIEERAPD